MKNLISNESEKNGGKQIKKSGISVEVARISGALRCGIEFDCRRDSSPIPKDINYSKSSRSTFSELLDDTIAYAQTERAKLLKEIEIAEKKI